MKGNKIDDLFRNKLDSSSSEVPTGAWDKIEAGLPQKKKKGVYFWIAMAASFTLIASVSWILLTGTDNADPINKNQQLAEDKEEPTEVIPKNDIPDEKQQETTDKQAPIQLIEPIAEEPSVLLADNTERSPLIVDETAALEVSKINIDPKTLNIELLKPKISNTLLQANLSSVKSINIDAKVLIQSAALSRKEFERMESSKGKKSGFLSSIVSVAKGVNSGAKALSEIRKSKNEFITTDLKYGVETDSEGEEAEDDDPSMNK